MILRRCKFGYYDVLASMYSLSHRAVLEFDSLNLFRQCNIAIKTTVPRSCHTTTDENVGEKSDVFDIIVVGGGIVGITTARALLLQHPNLKVAVLEKEKEIAMHQTGHNSGVIHAGVYYQPNSLKAQLCKEGLRQTYAFCDKHNLPYKKCGKLIVATSVSQQMQLKKLYKNALENEVPEVALIPKEKMFEIEPYCKGLEAIHSPHTGIIDWALFTKYCADDFQKRGGNLYCDFHVKRIVASEKGTKLVDISEAPVEFHATDGKTLRSKYAITCAGLYSDKIADLFGGNHEPRILPFRGEYMELKENKSYLVRGNIYPVPDPRFPFLGVHFTPRMDGRILTGPNAILAFSREGYRWNHINLSELWDMCKFKGFQNLILKYGEFGAKEMIKSFLKFLYVKKLQEYIPSIRTNDLEFRGYTGVRAQAVNDKGDLVDDMVLEFGTYGIQSRVLHCRNAPSPAATSSLALAEYITKAVYVEFDI